MADLMASAGVPPYLQFGEVQWWYFAAASGMPFYDSYTTSNFSGALRTTDGGDPQPECGPEQLSR